MAKRKPNVIAVFDRDGVAYLLCSNCAEKARAVVAAEEGALDGDALNNLAYGPLGRLKTTVSGTNARTVWNLGDLVERRIRADGVEQVERMVPGPLGAFVSLRTTLNASGAPTATETIYRHGDGRANRFFTKASGQAVQQATYAAFGAKTSDTGTQGITYTDDLWNGGDDLPEVGLTLLGPRAYDPAVGRFMQRDPIAVMTLSTTANPYAFSFNDPVNYADPSGLCGESLSGGVCALGNVAAVVGGATVLGTILGIGNSGDAHPPGRAHGASNTHVAGGVNVGGWTFVQVSDCVLGIACDLQSTGSFLSDHGDDIANAPKDFNDGINSVAKETGKAVVNTIVDCSPFGSGAVGCVKNHMENQWKAQIAFALEPRKMALHVVTGGSRNPVVIAGRITGFVIEAIGGEALSALAFGGEAAVAVEAAETAAASAPRVAVLDGAASEVPQISKAARLKANRLAGNAARDDLAQALQNAGRGAETEVYKSTPFGRRYIDIEVSLDGEVLGGIEVKLGRSRYHPLQRAKDMWLLPVKGYRVDLVGVPR